jgi:thymidylate kinase
LSRRAGPADRLEAEDITFHRRVRRSFLDLASHDRSRYLVLDATADPDALSARIAPVVIGMLPGSTGGRLRGIARGLAGARQ